MSQISSASTPDKLSYTHSENPNYLGNYGIGGLNIKSNNFLTHMDAFALSLQGIDQSSTVSSSNLYLAQSLTGYSQALSVTSRRLILSGSQSGQANHEIWHLGLTDIGAYDSGDPVTSLFSLTSERNIGGNPSLQHRFFSADPISGSLSIGTDEIESTSRMYVLESTDEKDIALRVRHEGPPLSSAFGLYGIFVSNDQSSITSRYGIFSFAGGSSTGNYGIYGSTDATAMHYGVYASGNLAYTATLSNVSDRKFKRDIAEFRALDRIMKLAPKTYEMKREEYRSMNLAAGRQFGFIAQELQKVFPELVHESLNSVPLEGTDGRVTNENIEYLGVDYISMVPILTQAMQEQQEIIGAKEERILRLEHRLDELEALVRKLTDPTTIGETGTGASLQQNQPNPSRAGTAIPYYIPPGVKRAALQLTDAGGRILKNIDLEQRGTGRLLLNTDQWSSGVYYYSLLVDGKVVDTRKMVTIK